MKLEPIFLAPRPVPRSMPTRRAWLLAGGAFVVGAVTGGACVQGLCGGSATPPVPLDPTHAWLRQLCDDASPIGELIRHRLILFMHLPRWADDRLLWHGIDRLVGAVLAKDDLADRRRLAAELVAMFEGPDIAPDMTSRWDIESLRAISRGR